MVVAVLYGFWMTGNFPRKIISFRELACLPVTRYVKNHKIILLFLLFFCHFEFEFPYLSKLEHDESSININYFLFKLI